MSRRPTTRVLIALVAPVLAATALAPAATAAGAAKVPTLVDTQTIYPHVGTVSASSAPVHGPGRQCGQQQVIRGASLTSASYSPDYSDPALAADPALYEMTGERPAVSATAMRFPTPKAAIASLHGYQKYAKKCPGSNPGGDGSGGGQLPDCDTAMKKIRFALGDERYGYQIRSSCTIGGQATSSVMNTLFVRDGRYVVSTSAMSMDASAPSIPSSVAFTKLALTTVG
jgi:hypothetical protein